jgi:hypothetical protein
MSGRPSGVEYVVMLIEAIVSDNRADDCGDDCAVPYWLLNGLVASWRRQRAVLLSLQQILPDELRDYGFRGRIDDALGDKP